MAEEKSIEDKIKDLKGNPGLLIPITALGQFAKNLSDGQQATLNRAIKKLSTQYFYLGELAFEHPKSSPELLEDKPRGFSIIRKIMKANGFDAGSLQNYNRHAALTDKREQSLDRKHGIGRRDIIRDELAKIFDIKISDSDLKISTRAEVQDDAHHGGKTLLIAFNIPAQAKEYFKAKHSDREPALADALDYGLKRLVTRAFLQSTRSEIPTDEAVKEYNSDDRKVKATVRDNVIRVRIPLDDEFYARMNKGRMDMDQLGQNIAKEVAFGVDYIQHAKPAAGMK